MTEIILSKGRQLTFIIPKEEGEGVRRVAKKVVEDVEKTTGLHPSMALDGKNLNQAVIEMEKQQNFWSREFQNWKKSRESGRFTDFI